VVRCRRITVSACEGTSERRDALIGGGIDSVHRTPEPMTTWGYKIPSTPYRRTIEHGVEPGAMAIPLSEVRSTRCDHLWRNHSHRSGTQLVRGLFQTVPPTVSSHSLGISAVVGQTRSEKTFEIQEWRPKSTENHNKCDSIHALRPLKVEISPSPAQVLREWSRCPPQMS